MAVKLFRSIFVLILANIIVKPLWIFGIDLKVQNVLGTEDYGLYFIVFNFSFLFHILLDFGINQFHNKELAQNTNLLKERFGNLLLLKGLFAILYFAFSLVLAYSLDFTVDKLKLLLLLLLNQSLLSLILFSRSNFTAMEWYSLDAFFSVFDRILSIILCALFLYTSIVPSFSLIHFIYAQTFSLALSAFLSIVLIFNKGKVHLPTFNLKILLPLVRQSLPYALVILLMTLYTRIDAVMLDMILPEKGNTEAGIYAAGYRLLDAINMIPYLFASLLIPFFAKQISLKEDFKRELIMAVQVMLAICIPFVFFVFVFHQDMMYFLYPDSNDTWTHSFQLLLFTFPFVFMIYVYGGFLTAAGKLTFISIFAAISIGLNIVLNSILIKIYGAAGAALATFFTQGLMAIVQFVYVSVRWKTVLPLNLVYKILIYAVACGVVLYTLQSIELIWWFKMLSFIIIALFLSFVLQLIEIKKLIALNE